MIASPTPAQKQAIETTGHNLIVSAAAGSGKTAVMVDRAVRMVLQGQELSRMLMVTFTNAAAAQMKQRIAQELSQAARQTDLPNRAHVRRQLTLVQSADISTVNAFCLTLVRRYFHLVEVDPLFAIADQSQQTLLEAEALDQTLDACFESHDMAFLQMLTHLCSGQEDRLRDAVLQIHHFARSSDDPQAWMQRACQMYQGGKEAEQAFDDYAALARQLLWERAAEPLQKAMDLLAQSPLYQTDEKTRVLHAKLQAAAQYMEPLLSQTPDPQIGRALTALVKRDKSAPVSFPQMRRPTAWDEQAFDAVKQYAGQCRDALKELSASPYQWTPYVFSRAQCLHMLTVLAPDVAAMLDVVQAFESRYAQVKREQNLLDFSDAEHLALRILQQPEAQADIQRRYDCVFVDEYQDTNDLQEAILTRIARPGTLFCVGDVKQSIYAFRHAEPQLFLRRYQQSHALPSPQTDIKIDLNQNFRSSAAILYSVNSIFARAMSERVGGLDYDQAQALVPGSGEAGTPVEVHLLIESDRAAAPLRSDADETDTAALDCQQRQARLCARQIRTLLTQTWQSKEGPRPYTYSDIAILTYSIKNKKTFVQTLQAEGIPVVSNLSGGLLSAQETGAVLALLQVIDYALDDVSMLTALRSPAAQCDAQDLARIRLFAPHEPFARAAHAFAANGQGPSAQKVRNFFQRLAQWRALARQKRVDVLLNDVYEQTQLLAYYAQLPGGAQKVQNLHALWQRAQVFATGGDGSLHGFLQMLDRYNKLGVDDSMQPPQGEHAVRLMTIHASKGLEFPVVLLPFLEQPQGLGTRGTRLRLDKRYGIGCKQYDAPTRSRQDSWLEQLMEQRAIRDDRSEKLRVFYVALTRAEHRLLLLAEDTPARLTASAQCKPEHAKRPLDWLAPVWAAHADGAALRETLGLPPAEDAGAVDGARWDIHLYDTEDMQQFESTQPESTDLHPSGAARQPAALDAMERWLTWQYPYAEQTALPSKVSATALNQSGHTALAPLAPLDLGAPDRPLYGAALGTAVHLALYHLRQPDFAHPQALAQRLDALAAQGVLTVAQRASIPLESLLQFGQSAVGRRMLSAQQVLREQPFTVQIPAVWTQPAADPHATVLLQGIIDCAFYENGGWVLLDYKTNRMPAGGLSQLADLYQVQIDVYRYALEQITGAPVHQAWLCLVHIGKNMEMPVRPDSLLHRIP